MGFLEELKEGKVSEDIKRIAAENAIPLPLKEQFEVLAFLMDDPIVEIADKASLTLMDMPKNSVISYLSGRDANPKLLKFYAEYALENKDYELIEVIVKNPSTSDSILKMLAEKGDEKIVDIVVSNQIRSIADHKILEAVVANPHSSIRAKALAKEWLRLYYSNKNEVEIIETVEEMAEEGALEDIEEIGDLEELETLEEVEEVKEISAAELKERLKNIYNLTWEDIKRLPIPAKIKVALMGSKMHRAILIRDPNKTVVDAVLESPKLTEDEIEGYSKMKSLPQDVVRKIAQAREWTKNYQVRLNLVKNPKTPTQYSLSFLRTLREKDLKDVAMSKEVPAVVRREAQRILNQKKKIKF
ncbi:MAG: hypothetical protein J7L62_03480 [Candidatus Aminicenantes bacterium]|nr:hypothetical protein [Candidatus Aminicenantes bacterium]